MSYCCSDRGTVLTFLPSDFYTSVSGSYHNYMSHLKFWHETLIQEMGYFHYVLVCTCMFV